MNHDTTYIHSQTGLVTAFATLAGAIAAAFGYAAVRRATGTHGPASVLAVIAVIMIVLSVVFSRLTISVGAGKVSWWFGLGVFRKSVPLTDVVSAAPVRNSWTYGWGIRLTPYGWLYNVSGLDAVEITLTSGRRFRLGTDEPDLLTRAITVAPR